MLKIAICHVDNCSATAALESAQGLTDGYHHEDGGHPEGQAVALVFSETGLFPEDGGQDGGDHGAEVDGGVKDSEEGGHFGALLRQDKLIRAKAHDAWFDPTGAKADQDETEERDGSFGVEEI